MHTPNRQKLNHQNRSSQTLWLFFGCSKIGRRGKNKQACSYRGEDCVKQFLAALLQTEAEIREELTHKKKMQMTREDWRAFDAAKECHICKEDLIRYNETDETELWDSETGAYIGKVHRYKQAPVQGDKPMSCF